MVWVLPIAMKFPSINDPWMLKYQLIASKTFPVHDKAGVKPCGRKLRSPDEY